MGYYGKSNDKQPVSMKIDGSINTIIEQLPGSNSFLSMRMISWNQAQPRLDIRRWYTDSQGNENPGKGFSFATESGPNNLAVALVQNGYGETTQILNSIKNREDFEESLNEILGKTNKTLYDPKSILV